MFSSAIAPCAHLIWGKGNCFAFHKLLCPHFVVSHFCLFIHERGLTQDVKAKTNTTLGLASTAPPAFLARIYPPVKFIWLIFLKYQMYQPLVMACQTLHYSIFLYFYRILLHYYCIFWDLYLISGHFYSICFVSILYSMICIQYIRFFIV